MSGKSDIVVLGLVGAGLYFIYKKGSDFFGGASDVVSTYKEEITNTMKDVWRGTSYSDAETIFDSHGWDSPNRSEYEDAFSDNTYTPRSEAIRLTASNFDPLGGYSINEAGNAYIDALDGTKITPYAFSGVGTSPIIPTGNYDPSSWINFSAGNYQIPSEKQYSSLGSISVSKYDYGSGVVSNIGSVLNPGDAGYLEKYDYRLHNDGGSSGGDNTNTSTTVTNSGRSITYEG